MLVKENPTVEKQQGLVHKVSWHETTQKGNKVSGCRDDYLLHLVLGGSGRFTVNGKTYTPQKGDAFLIYPQTPFVYQSDDKDPWQYVWVHFDGTECEELCRAMGFSREHPIGTFGDLEHLHGLHQKTEQIPFDDFAWQIEHKIRLYAFFKGMIENRRLSSDRPTEVTKRRVYFNKAVDYIMNHLEEESLSAECVAAQIPICRKYLLTLFREFCQTTTNDFIMSKRVEQAKRLLQYTAFTVGEVAAACGYKDILTFSRMFKKRVGVSPRTYRQQKNSGQPG